jgi:hypothetical protein
MVRAAGDTPPGSSGLRVRIDPVTQTLPTTIRHTTASSWDLKWIDMSPWSGMQVTVTFELVQDAGDPAQTVYIDDISLGSINPNLWLFLASGPGTAIPGEIVAVTLDYGNRGALLAEESVVELALPPDVFLVSATPPYIEENNVVTWNVGELQPNGDAKRLRIEVSPAARDDEVLTLKGLIYTATKELHLRDNTSQTSFRVIKKLHLPLIAGS